MNTKKIMFLIGVLILVLITASYGKPRPFRDFKIVSVKKHVLYFKVDKSFVGGWVEIYDETKSCLEADSLPHTHTMIYFDEVPAGHYTVKVKKGDKSTEFNYDNI
jgi:hypothetical protein